MDNSRLSEEITKSPLLSSLCRMAEDLAGVGLCVIYPCEQGWAQISPTSKEVSPEFCQLIHKTKDGERQCERCHVLMSISSCTSGLSVQQCHAGVSTLVAPISETGHEALAVLTTCVFAEGDEGKSWKITSRRGKKLGIKPEKLKVAYEKLPEMNASDIDRASEILTAFAEAIREITRRLTLEAELEHIKQLKGAQNRIRTTIAQELKQGAPKKMPVQSTEKSTDNDTPHLVSVVEKLVTSKPDMPFSVEDIAAAARVTPNHFSALFKRHTGETFTEYVSRKRIALAKTLLSDFTLSIGEIAYKSGYDDPGYFARRFKKYTGRSPREWREQL